MLFRSVRIRVLPSEIHRRTFALLGADPQVMDLKPAIAAVVDGSLDAQENPLANTVDYKVHQYHRYHTLSGHSYLSRGLYCNRAQFESWPRALQAAMQRACDAAIKAQRELATEEEEIARKTIEAAGGAVVELTAAERTQFVKAVQPLVDEEIGRAHV